MIDAGKIIAGGSPKELKEKYLDKQILEIESDDLEATLETLDNIEWIVNASFFGNYVHAASNFNNESGLTIDDKIKIIGKELIENKIKVKRIEKIIPSLEDVFVNLLEPGGQKNAV